MSLDVLALKYGTDKASNHHNYTKVYDQYFNHLRNEPITLVELGHGGYEFYDRGGQSVRMWKDYFYRGHIVSIDYYEKKPIEGIEFHRRSQDDKEFLESVIVAPDIIIDDASHNSKLTIDSFKILFPLLNPGGWYVVEDTHCSYWEPYGGGHHDYTTLNYFKNLTDSLNWEESNVPTEGIASIHFHQKMVFVRKM